jgi:predicted NBD/HSP70 family sugar kinase
VDGEVFTGRSTQRIERKDTLCRHTPQARVLARIADPLIKNSSNTLHNYLYYHSYLKNCINYEQRDIIPVEDTGMSVVLAKYRKVLQYIQSNSPVDKSSIAEGLGVSLMTVNKIVNRLQQTSIVIHCGKQEGRNGRRSDLFKFNPDLFLSIGLDIDDDRIILGAVNSDGRAICRQEYSYKGNQDLAYSAENIIKGIEGYYSSFLMQNDLHPDSVAVVGIAPHGIIDTENGRCLLGTHLGGIIDLNLREELESRIALPVYVNDPARALAYYETKYGHGQEVDNFIYVFLDKGVGSGIVIDRKIHLGASGMAGEIGHLIVSENGERCKCGNYGCLETVASVGSIIRQVQEGVRDGVMTKILDFCNGNVDGIDLHVLKTAADNNDKFSLNILDSIGSKLGKAVSVLINLFNPELILLGGQVSVLGQYLLDPALRVIQHNSLNLLVESARIRIVEYDPFRESAGIAVEAFDSLFNGSREWGSQGGSGEVSSEGRSRDSFLDSLLRDIVPA